MSYGRESGRSARRWALALGGALTVAVVLVIVFAVPWPHPFDFPVTATGCGGAVQAESYRAGSSVSGSWATASSALPAQVEILGPGSSVVYAADGTNGTFRFAATTGSYTFEVFPSSQEHVACPVAPTVSFTGQWSSDLWDSEGW